MVTSGGEDADVVRVERTGIALVHEGEYIAPDPVSLARLQIGNPTTGSIGDDNQSGDDGFDGGPGTDRSIPDEVHYWFPVEIEILGTVGTGVTAGGDASGDAAGALTRTVVARVFDELQQELASWG